VLRDINDRFGTTTVVITHNAEIQRMAHRVIFFQDGKIIETRVNSERIAPSEIAW
jgi:putative ABC transport system ATP-binding protein